MSSLLLVVIKGVLVSMVVGALIRLGVKELTKSEQASNMFGLAAMIFTLLVSAGIISIVNVLGKG